MTLQRKTVLFLVLLSTLFVSAIGCDSKIDLTKSLMPEGEYLKPLTLNVNDEVFIASGQYIVMKDSGQKHFVLIVCPEAQKREYQTAIGYETKISTGRYDFLGEVLRENGKKLFAAHPDTVYFVDDKKVLFSKKRKELDAESLDTLNFLKKENLQPILETMIRENVKPKESEN